MSDKRTDDRVALASLALVALLVLMVTGGIALLWRNDALLSAGLIAVGAIWGLRRLS